MSANIHKLELYIVDAIGDYGNIDRIMDVLEMYTDCFYRLANSKSAKFTWNDDLDINNVNATNEDYEKYFNQSSEEVETLKENELDQFGLYEREW